MASPLVIANWKMNGELVSNAKLAAALVLQLAELKSVDIGLCAPFPYLAQLQTGLEGSAIKSGAQNVNAAAAGAYTGEVSCEMLKEFACHYVLLGHSERRSLYHESNQQVAEKFAAVVQAGLVPVLCVGESLAQWQSSQTNTVVAEQINAVLSEVGIEAFSKAVIAYEPIWAIGTGETASPEQAQAVHAHIRALLAQHSQNIANNLPIIYGGSVKAVNAQALFAQPDIDGGLVGGASLDSDEFIQICTAAQ